MFISAVESEIKVIYSEEYCAIYGGLIMQSGTELCQTIGHIFSFNFAK